MHHSLRLRVVKAVEGGCLTPSLGTWQQWLCEHLALFSKFMPAYETIWIDIVLKQFWEIIGTVENLATFFFSYLFLINLFRQSAYFTPFWKDRHERNCWVISCFQTQQNQKTKVTFKHLFAYVNSALTLPMDFQFLSVHRVLVYVTVKKIY